MKFNNILLFVTIASVLTLNAFADPATITTQDYVDAADALKQDKIETDTVSFSGEGGEGAFSVEVPAIISYDTTDDLTGDKIGLLSRSTIDNVDIMFEEIDENVSDSLVPTVGAVDQELGYIYAYTGRLHQEQQMMIGKSGYSGKDNMGRYDPVDAQYGSSWLNSMVKGTGLVTKTSNDGHLGERKIFEASDVSGYHATGLTQIQKDIQDISIPTVGAMMAAISNNQVTLPTGTANSIVMYDANGNIGGSRTIATSVGTNTSATTIPTTGAVVTGLNTKQNKMTCTRWLDNAEHTDANCLLWNIN
ncbi:MAG: hypothetical protein J5620_01005 [Alphaproteobacteria bacterium]|nr:hypothetical protein [Alphaproteobacteria bacterium]